MKLFGKFEAVRFPEEDLILVAKKGYLYYVYNPTYDCWEKFAFAGNKMISVSKYPNVSKEEIVDALHGKFPKKETDILRYCHPSQLCIRDMMDLLCEDYPKLMSNYDLRHEARIFLIDSKGSTLVYKFYLLLRSLFDLSVSKNLQVEEVIIRLEKLYFEKIGTDINKKEIEIVDGHDSGSCFWIMPVRVIDYSNSESSENVAELRSLEISIDEDDVGRYLSPFLRKYFDDELIENKSRDCASGFEWYLTYNYYTFESVKCIINDIKDEIVALSGGKETEFTKRIIEDCRFEKEIIIDFYKRFIYRMEYMLTIGKENGYELISFMGP